MTKFEKVKRNLTSWANDCEADPQDSEDIKYVFDRIKRLEEALIEIQSTYDDFQKHDEIARKALEEVMIPKDLAKKRDLRFSRMEQGVDQWIVPLCKESFDAGVEAAFESEHILALVEAVKFYAGEYEYKDKKWGVWDDGHVCDSYSGSLSTFDWNGELQEEPWGIAKEALAKWSKRNG